MFRLLLAACVLSATAAVAEPVRLTDDKIRQLLTGSLLEVDTPLGTTVPVRFSSAGLVSGEAGSLASVLGAAKDRGRWWTKDDHLCVKWFRWFEAQTRCAVISHDGEKIYLRGTDGKNGTARIARHGTPAQEKPGTPAKTKVAAATHNAAAAEERQEPADAAKLETAAADAPKPEAAASAADDATTPAAAIVATAVATAPAAAEVATAQPVMAEAAAAVAAAQEPAVAETISLDPAGARLAAARIAAARIAAPFATLPVKTVPVTAAADEDSAHSRFALAASLPSSFSFFSEASESTASETAAEVQPAVVSAAAVTTAAEAAPAPDDAGPAAPAAAPATRVKAAQVFKATRAAILASPVTRPTFRVAGVERDDALNVRSGPSQYSEIVGEIAPRGSGVVIVGQCQESWCPIEHDQVRGWVNRNYLAAESASAVH